MQIAKQSITPQIKAQNDSEDIMAKDITEEFIRINGEKFTKTYKKIAFLGKGGFAQCYLTKQKETDHQAATKIIPKKLLDSFRTKLRLANEIKLHKSLRNEYIVEFYNNFQDEENVYINLQVCDKGSINDILRTRYTFSVPEIQSFVYGICQGIKYLHSRNIIHRDLKLGNIFLSSDFKIKIGDFGLATKLQFSNQYKRTVCGTPNYIAPQILQGKGYHFEVDIWAIGVMIYTLFYTIPPFQTETPHDTYQKIRKGDYQFPKYDDVPAEGIDLIKKILVNNPANRLTLQQILNSPFMRLGAGIPLGLPSICVKRPPTKKQLSNWPSLPFNETKVLEKNEMNTSVLQFFGFSRKSIKSKTIPIQNLDEAKLNSSQFTFCRTIQQVQNKLIVFYLNNGNFGCYDLQNFTIFTCQLKDIKNLQSVKRKKKNDTQLLQVSLNQCPHKLILSIKHKQLIKQKSQATIQSALSKDITISKINLYKDLFMIRLTNRSIQIKYKQKDGFLISPDYKSIHYFYNFIEYTKGRQIVLVQLQNFGQKQNKLPASEAISHIFKTKNEKNLLTAKKVNYLKGILSELAHRNSNKNY